MKYCNSKAVYGKNRARSIYKQKQLVWHLPIGNTCLSDLCSPHPDTHLGTVTRVNWRSFGLHPALESYHYFSLITSVKASALLFLCWWNLIGSPLGLLINFSSYFLTFASHDITRKDLTGWLSSQKFGVCSLCSFRGRRKKGGWKRGWGLL